MGKEKRVNDDRCFACEQLAERVATLELQLSQKGGMRAELADEVSAALAVALRERDEARAQRDELARASLDFVRVSMERGSLAMGRLDAIEARLHRLEAVRPDQIADRPFDPQPPFQVVELVRERDELREQYEGAVKECERLRAERRALEVERDDVLAKLERVRVSEEEPPVLRRASRVFACGVVEDGVWSVGDVAGVEASGFWIVRFQERADREAHAGGACVSVPIEKLIETYSPEEDDEPQFSAGPIEVGTRVVKGRDGDYTSGVVTDDYGMNTAGVLWEDGVWTRETRFDLGRLGPRSPGVAAGAEVKPFEPELEPSISDVRCGAASSDGTRCARLKGHRRVSGHAAVDREGRVLRWGASDWTPRAWFVSFGPDP